MAPANNESTNKQWNNNRTTAKELTAPEATIRGLNVFYWRQIFALDSAVVKTQSLFS